MAMNSTPSRPKFIMVFTAFPPEPPQPITLIRAWYSWVSSANSIEKLMVVSSRGNCRVVQFRRPSEGASSLFLARP